MKKITVELTEEEVESIVSAFEFSWSDCGQSIAEIEFVIRLLMSIGRYKKAYEYLTYIAYVYGIKEDVCIEEELEGVTEETAEGFCKDAEDAISRAEFNFRVIAGDNLNEMSLSCDI